MSQPNITHYCQHNNRIFSIQRLTTPTITSIYYAYYLFLNSIDIMAFRYLKCVLTGTLAYWNTHKTEYQLQLRQKAGSYPPAIAALLEYLVDVSGGILVHEFLDPIGKHRVIIVDVKQISPEQFKSLIHHGMVALLSVFIIKNPELQSKSFAALDDLIKMTPTEHELAKNILSDRDSFDVSKVTNYTVNSMRSVLNLHSVSLIETYVASVLFAHSYRIFEKAYLESLAGLTGKTG